MSEWVGSQMINKSFVNWVSVMTFEGAGHKRELSDFLWPFWWLLTANID